jgi:hypothetical protein
MNRSDVKDRLAAIFEMVGVSVYVALNPVLSAGLIAQLLNWLATNPDGTLRWTWVTFIVLSPLIYFAWLVCFLVLCVADVQLCTSIVGFAKRPRATMDDGLSSGLMLLISRLLYLRARFIVTLPLVDAMYPIAGLRQMALLAYSPSTHLGKESQILGLLFDPDITEIGDHVILGFGSSVIAHSMTRTADGQLLMVNSPVTIGARTVVGGGSQIHPGVSIGCDVILEPASCVHPFTKIDDGEVWGGNPARFLRKREFAMTGTINHGASQELLKLGTASQDPDNERQLHQIVSRVLNPQPDTKKPTPADLDAVEWNSLARLAIAAELQTHFGVTLSSQESFKLYSIDCLRDVIVKHQNLVAAYDPQSQ